MNYFKFKSINEDLGSTIIENVFINHYMISAPGDYVKVYILGLKYSQNYDGCNLSNNTIAKTLQISEQTVMDSWLYWKKQGIIELTPHDNNYDSDDFTIVYLSIKEIMLNIKDSDKKDENFKYSPQRIIDARKNKNIHDMFEYIKRISGRDASTTEMFEILNWIEDYGFSPEVVIVLYDDCHSRGKKDFPYLRQVARNWFDANIKTIQDVSSYLENHKQKWQKFGRILNFFRMGRPNAKEEEFLNTWFFTYNQSEEVILKACELMSEKTMKPSFAYLDKILKEWHENGLDSIEKIEEYKKSKKESKKSSDKKPSFNNFENRTYDTKLLKERLLKNTRGEISE